jgi:hypothetical protein
MYSITLCRGFPHQSSHNGVNRAGVFVAPGCIPLYSKFSNIWPREFDFPYEECIPLEFQTFIPSSGLSREVSAEKVKRQRVPAVEYFHHQTFTVLLNTDN